MRTESPAAGHRFIRFAACLIAIAPAILAIGTFIEPHGWASAGGFASPILASEFAIVIASLVAGWRPATSLLALGRNKLIVLLIWLAVVVISSARAPYPEVASLFLPGLLIHSLFSLALFERFAARDDRGAETILRSVGIGALIYCVLAFGLLFTIRDRTGYDWVFAGVGVSNVRQFAFFGLTCSAVGAASVVAGQKLISWRNSVGYILHFAGSTIVFWSGGRSGAGALCLVILVAIARLGVQRRLVVIAVFVAITIWAAFSSELWTPNIDYGFFRIFELSRYSGDDINRLTSNRWQIWADALYQMTDRPFVGYGMGQFKWIVPSALKTYTHPHNFIIQFLFQWGIVGTAAIAVIVAPILMRVPVALLGKPIFVSLSASYLLIGHLSMGLLEGNLFHSYPTFVVVLALAALSTASGRSIDVT